MYERHTKSGRVERENKKTVRDSEHKGVLSPTPTTPISNHSPAQSNRVIHLNSITKVVDMLITHSEKTIGVKALSCWVPVLKDFL